VETIQGQVERINAKPAANLSLGALVVLEGASGTRYALLFEFRGGFAASGRVLGQALLGRSPWRKEPRMSTEAWVWTLTVLYWAYCIYWGVRGAIVSKTASGYMIGGRQIPMIIFILAATATSFSGWTFIGHPGLIWRDGLSYAFASFYVLTIPITGTWFAKRQWLLGKRYGFITPGDMYSYYYGTEAMRWLVVIVALLYSSFYSAVQLIASGALFHWVTGVPIVWGSILLAAIVVFYVAAGGLRSIAWVDMLQCVWLVAGIIVLGMLVLHSVGGWTDLSARINALDPRYLTIPGGPGIKAGADPGSGIIQFTSGTTIWTGMMILTYMFSLMGIQASPAFTMWSFSNKNPRPFPWQQAIASTFFVGFALFFFTAIQGMGGRVVMDALGITSDRDLVPKLIHSYAPGFWAAFVVIGALAAMQSTAAPYIATGSTILCRDVYFRYMRPTAGHGEQIWMSRLFAILITCVAMWISVKSSAALVMLGGLATAFGTLMYVGLLGVCYGWPIKGVGAFAGLLAGIITVLITDVQVSPWSKTLGYLWTIHSAGWGLLVGLIVAFLFSRLFRDSPEIEARRKEMRDWLSDIDRPTESQKAWRRAMWVVVPVWYIFAIGPGAVLGNTAFSFMGFPPLWSWQIVWWLLGIVMMWAMCFKAGLSFLGDAQIQRAERDTKIVVHEVAPAAIAGGSDADLPPSKGERA
jgi:SSS family solute:Na+ symporter